MRKLTKMSGNRLLDTNIVIAFFKEDPDLLKEIAHSKIYIPSIVIGELRFGAGKSIQKKSNQARLDELIKEVIVLPVTLETAQYYGEVKN